MPETLPPMFAYLKSNVIHNDAELKPSSVLSTRGETMPCAYTPNGCLQPDFLRKLISSIERPSTSENVGMPASINLLVIIG
jgi:hypothetical protein